MAPRVRSLNSESTDKRVTARTHQTLIQDAVGFRNQRILSADMLKHHGAKLLYFSFDFVEERT